MKDFSNIKNEEDDSNNTLGIIKDWKLGGATNVG